jgi:hypothetical protein
MACFGIAFLSGFFYPVALMATTLIAIYLYKLIVYPSVIKIRKIDKVWRREFFVPLITYIRNLSTNLGYLYGFIEYNRNPVFKEQLDKYLPK